MKKHIVLLVHRYCAPIDRAAHVVHAHLPGKKRTKKLVIGALIVFSGASMAHAEPLIASHVLWDAIAWGLHGYGALPFVRLIDGFIQIEDI